MGVTGGGIPALLQSQRTVWLAGRRGDILRLAPLLRRLRETAGPDAPHWLHTTGEEGTAAVQALDTYPLRPDSTALLLHPAESPAVRLRVLMERADDALRERKAGRIIFTGHGPAAAAAALVCQARGCPGLWLRPADPAATLAHLRWESSLAGVIRACAPEVAEVPLAPFPLAGLALGSMIDVEREIPGLGLAAPFALVAPLRREWGLMDDAGSRIARGIAAAARLAPAVTWVVVTNLAAGLERPLLALSPRPANLLLTPPLPPALFAALLARAALVLTDGPDTAAAALARGIPLATLGDSAEAFPASAPAPAGGQALLRVVARAFAAGALAALAASLPAPAEPASQGNLQAWTSAACSLVIESMQPDRADF